MDLPSYRFMNENKMFCYTKKKKKKVQPYTEMSISILPLSLSLSLPPSASLWFVSIYSYTYLNHADHATHPDLFFSDKDFSWKTKL